MLSTRFAATFVLVAGISVTLLTNRSRTSRDRLADPCGPLAARAPRVHPVRRRVRARLDLAGDDPVLLRRVLRRRCAVVHAADRAGDLLVGIISALAGAGLAWWEAIRESDGRDTDWLFDPDTLQTSSPRGLLFDTFVNGTHPLLPWLAFLCIGIVVGRCDPAPAAGTADRRRCRGDRRELRDQPCGDVVDRRPGPPDRRLRHGRSIVVCCTRSGRPAPPSSRSA